MSLGGWSRFAAAPLLAVSAACAMGLSPLIAFIGGRPARAQVIDMERPRTLLVGLPRGGARSDRVDGSRGGCARTPLPVTGLRTEWHTSLGMPIDRAPLVDGSGNTYVVGGRGEVVSIARDGAVSWRASTLVAQAGPLAMLADGTVVFVGAAGEAVGVRDGTVRWRVRVGPESRRSETSRGAPLALSDGGVIVTVGRDLVALDADGGQRARTTLAEPTTLPLVAALDKVAAVTVTGAVWTWTPGAMEPTRVGTFGGPLDGSAALVEGHTLVGVTAAQTRLSAVDLLAGSAAIAHSVAPPGSVWLGPPAIRRNAAYVLLLSATGELASEIVLRPRDGGGAELTPAAPVLLHARGSSSTIDGGAVPLAGLPHTPPLVDASGTIAFATVEGDIGVAGPQGVDLVADACQAPRTSQPDEANDPSPVSGSNAPPAVAGLAPLAPGAFVAACRSGVVVAVHGAIAQGLSPPRTAPPTASPDVPKATAPGPAVGGEIAVPRL